MIKTTLQLQLEYLLQKYEEQKKFLDIQRDNEISALFDEHIKSGLLKYELS